MSVILVVGGEREREERVWASWSEATIILGDDQKSVRVQWRWPRRSWSEFPSGFKTDPPSRVTVPSLSLPSFLLCPFTGRAAPRGATELRSAPLAQPLQPRREPLLTVFSPPFGVHYSSRASSFLFPLSFPSSLLLFRAPFFLRARLLPFYFLLPPPGGVDFHSFSFSRNHLFRIVDRFSINRGVAGPPFEEGN